MWGSASCITALYTLKKTLNIYCSKFKYHIYAFDKTLHVTSNSRNKIIELFIKLLIVFIFSGLNANRHNKD